jgi:capsule polysaccharide export protein KpsE/RkpR
MKSLFSFSLLIVGLVLLYLGLESSDSFGSSMSELVHDTPSNKSLILLVTGVLTTVAGGMGFFRRI